MKINHLLIALIFVLFSARQILSAQPSYGVPLTIQAKFKEWTKIHGKTYANSQEYRKRQSIWYENYKFIEKTNSKKLTYRLGINKFSDLTAEEFNGRQGIVHKPDSKHLELSRLLVGITSSPEEEVKDHPQKLDWVEKGVVPIPRTQDVNCGQSVGAYTAVGSAEANWKIKHGDDSKLSVQYALDCKTGAAYRCGIAYLDLFAYFLLRDKAYTVENYPNKFTGLPQKCPFDSSSVSASSGDYPSPKFNLPFLINEFDIGMENTIQSWTFTALAKIPQALVQHYNSGIITGHDCSAGSTQLYYTVMVVGYDKTASTPNWKVQWANGEDWGEQGYMRIEKVDGAQNSGPCELGERPSYIPPL